MRVIRPEEEDRRTDIPPQPESKKKPEQDKPNNVRESGVESMPDGETAAAEEAKKARDD